MADKTHTPRFANIDGLDINAQRFDDGLGGFYEAQGFVPFEEPLKENTPKKCEYEFHVEFFNYCIGCAEKYIKKTVDTPANYVLASMFLEHLQYKESSYLLKDDTFKKIFCSAKSRLETARALYEHNRDFEKNADNFGLSAVLNL